MDPSIMEVHIWQMLDAPFMHHALLYDAWFKFSKKKIWAKHQKKILLRGELKMGHM